MTMLGQEPIDCMRRVQAAINAHDLEALADCFEENYNSTFPAHPDRAFVGRTQMRQNWSQILGGVPDLQAELLRAAVEGDTVWTEWEWRGTRRDGKSFLQRGVTLQGVAQGRIKWARLYMELVEEGGAGADASVQRTIAGGR